MKLIPITAKQQDILKQLYRYRFLTRLQLQAIMGHTDKRRISAWLKDLRDKQYIDWIYNGSDFIEKSKPAIYYLGLNGIRFLRTTNSYPNEELRKRYREASRQPDFIARCLTVTGACLNLEYALGGVSYEYVTEADYTDPESAYHFLTELKPQLCFVKTAGSSDDIIKTNYLLEVFDTTTPRYKVKQKLKDYVSYLEGYEWQDNLETKPIVLVACPTKADLIYAKRRTKKLFEDFDKDDDTHIRFATAEQVKHEGVTGIIWEEA